MLKVADLEVDWNESEQRNNRKNDNKKHFKNG